jgi:hypothetical protein
VFRRITATLAAVIATVALTAPVAQAATPDDDDSSTPAFIQRSSWG